MKRGLAIGIAVLLGLIILWIALGDPAATHRTVAWFLLAVSLLIGAWLAMRKEARASLTSQTVWTGWQGQSRGTASALLAVGAVSLVIGLFYDAANPPNHYGVLFFSSAALCLGVGIHRNVRVVRAYFGPGPGRLLNSLQFTLPVIAFALDYAAELVTNPETKWLLRFLSVIPFVFLYLVIWVPLSRFVAPPAKPDEATIGRLG